MRWGAWRGGAPRGQNRGVQEEVKVGRDSWNSGSQRSRLNRGGWRGRSESDRVWSCMPPSWIWGLLSVIKGSHRMLLIRGRTKLHLPFRKVPLADEGRCIERAWVFLSTLDQYVLNDLWADNTGSAFPSGSHFSLHFHVSPSIWHFFLWPLPYQSFKELWNFPLQKKKKGLNLHFPRKANQTASTHV